MENNNNNVITIESLAGMIKRSFDKIDDRFDKVDNRLDKINNRLDMIENRLDKVENRLDKVENRLDKVEARLDQLEENNRLILRKLGENVIYRNEFEVLETRVKFLEQSLSTR